MGTFIYSLSLILVRLHVEEGVWVSLLSLIGLMRQIVGTSSGLVVRIASSQGHGWVLGQVRTHNKESMHHIKSFHKDSACSGARDGTWPNE